MTLFGNLNLWIDTEPRRGPEAMAVDEWILETASVPTLRLYRWDGAWASFGYFGRVADAEAEFPGVPLVRRWSGGGMVDHRQDWTYTLIIPAGEPLAKARGAESYRRIHALLAEVLAEEGFEVGLSGGEHETGEALCFRNPVNHDLVASGGLKVAGAGQRRTRAGLLHQGSVAVGCADDAASVDRGREFAGRLASVWRHCQLVPMAHRIDQLVETRYGHPGWSNRR